MCLLGIIQLPKFKIQIRHQCPRFLFHVDIHAVLSLYLRNLWKSCSQRYDVLDRKAVRMIVKAGTALSSTQEAKLSPGRGALPCVCTMEEDFLWYKCSVNRISAFFLSPFLTQCVIHTFSGPGISEHWVQSPSGANGFTVLPHKVLGSELLYFLNYLLFLHCLLMLNKATDIFDQYWTLQILFIFHMC